MTTLKKEWITQLFIIFLALNSAFATALATSFSAKSTYLQNSKMFKIQKQFAIKSNLTDVSDIEWAESSFKQKGDSLQVPIVRSISFLGISYFILAIGLLSTLFKKNPPDWLRHFWALLITSQIFLYAILLYFILNMIDTRGLLYFLLHDTKLEFLLGTL